MTSLSLRVRIEDEMESHRDGIGNQLERLLHTPKKSLSSSIKDEIRIHLANFNFDETWMEDGEYLLGRAYANMSQHDQHEEYDESSYDTAEDYTDIVEATNHLDETVELWESRLDIGKNKSRGYRRRTRT